MIIDIDYILMDWGLIWLMYVGIVIEVLIYTVGIFNPDKINDMRKSVINKGSGAYLLLTLLNLLLLCVVKGYIQSKG